MVSVGSVSSVVRLTFASLLTRRLGSVLLAMTVGLAIIVIDGLQRPHLIPAVGVGPTQSQQSSQSLQTSQNPQTPKKVQSADEAVRSTAWTPLDRGHIPMPPGARAAHASTLLAMPADHPAALTAFWFAGDRESAANVQIAASQFDRRTQAWMPARFVVDRNVAGPRLGFGLRRLGNPVAWLDDRKRVHLFVVATGLGGWAASRIVHLVQSSASSKLDSMQFEADRVLPLSWLWNISFLVRNNPVPLVDGGMLLPVHFELGTKYPVGLRVDASGAMVGMTRISRRNYLLQPTVLALDATHWIALMRNQQPDAHVAVAQSEDAGQHWEDLPDLALTNPDAAIQGLVIDSQTLLLAHNSSPHSRDALDLSSSTDGLHWVTSSALARGGEGEEFSYPSLAWSDSTLWVSYTDHRQSIAWQRYSRAP